MKTVLVIAPSSYPVNGAEAIVNIKLLQAMTASGKFQIDLLSKKNKWSHYPSGTIESYGVKCNLNVIEVDNNPFSLKVIWQNFMTLFKVGIVFKGCHWAFPAIEQSSLLVKTKRYDYVLTKNEPSFLVGYYIKKKYGVKWVASWNDPYPRDNYPAPYGHGPKYRSMLIKRKIRIMRNADVHIFPSARLMDYMNTYLCLPETTRKIVVPHIINPEPVQESLKSGTLRFLHAGDLKSPRSPKIFIDGLQIALKRNPSMRIRFSIMGVMSEKAKAYAKEIGVDSYIEFIPPCEYRESLKRAKDFDISLIIEANCEEGIFLPTKVGDCMQCNLIMFAVSPVRGNLNDLYHSGHIQYFADVTSAESVADEILKSYSDFEAGKLIRKANYKNDFLPEYAINKYSNI